jgi:Ca-activated chloride channel family protein
MKPLQPESADKNVSTPGEGKEAGREATPIGREPRAVKPSRQPVQAIGPKAAEARAAARAQHAALEKSAPENAAEAPLTARVEMAPSPWKPDKLLVRVTVKAKPVAPPARPPASVVFAIDVSQSMAGPNRLPLVEEGIRLLAERLRPEDRVSVVTYAASAKEMLPSAPLGAKALELRNCLAELEAGGQTNGDEGLRLAYAVARRARVAVGPNVVVLCTDGNFNLGETDEQVLAAQAQQAAAEGIKLSVFGFGRSDRNDLRLELLATKGGGRSCYVNTREDAEQLLAGQIDGLLTPVAHQVSLRVTFDTTQVDAVARLGGIADDAASQRVESLLPGRSLSALYEITPVSGRATAPDLGEWETSYRRAGAANPERLTARLDRMSAEWTNTSADFRFATAWAELARNLKSGRGAGAGDLDRLEAWVQRVLPDDTGGYRTELLENITAARGPAGQVGR